MRILEASAANFQSYPEVSFEYKSLGLALVCGPTGAGKSTLLDLVCWTLYGSTSKGGLSDDVRPWGCKAPTTAQVSVEVPVGTLTVHRKRGASNDLYWLEEGSDEPQRGKDLSDTQRLLNERLGIDEELFIVGSYMTQFSKADSFFLASAKESRKVLEKISDQTFAARLGDRVLDARKGAKKQLDKLENDKSNLEGRRSTLLESLEALGAAEKAWQKQHAAKAAALQQRVKNFAQEQKEALVSLLAESTRWEDRKKTRIKELSVAIAAEGDVVPDAVYAQAMADVTEAIKLVPEVTCSECGALTDAQDVNDYVSQLNELKLARQADAQKSRSLESLRAQLTREQDAINPHSASLESAKQQQNHYGVQLEALLLENNPFGTQILEVGAKVKEAENKCRKSAELVESEALKVNRLNWLYDKSLELRGMMMEAAVSRIQSSTNGYLERFFDAALRVEFKLKDSDKLDVKITNNGHPCSFTALSGGERCMLKLAFTTSLMRAAQDKAGVSFNVICLDEPFNGLDESLKENAFGLLQELSTAYETILVIEHSEGISNLFSQRYLVDKINGASSIRLDE